MSTMSNFRNDHSFKIRREEASRIIKKYPDRVPIICERSRHCTELPELDRKKYLTPGSLTFAQFMLVIRKRIDMLESDQALYCFVGDSSMVPVGKTLNEVYNEFKHEDGFLYVTFASESTFG